MLLLRSIFRQMNTGCIHAPMNNDQLARNDNVLDELIMMKVHGNDTWFQVHDNDTWFQVQDNDIWFQVHGNDTWF